MSHSQNTSQLVSFDSADPNYTKSLIRYCILNISPFSNYVSTIFSEIVFFFGDATII